MALGTNALSRVWAIGSQVSTKPGAGSWKMKMCLQGVWEAETLTWSSCAISKGLIDRGGLGPGLIISAFPERPLGSLCSVNLGRGRLLPALRLPFHAKEVSSYPRESPSH